MNWKSFISLIQQPSDSAFFIASTRQSDQIGKTLSALLNTNGGVLVIGYDKVNVHLTGYNESDEWINTFIDDHFGSTLSITNAFLFRSNKKVLILEILKADNIQAYKNQYYHINNRQIEEFHPQTTPAYNFKISQPVQPQPISISQELPSIQTDLKDNLNEQTQANSIPNTPIANESTKTDKNIPPNSNNSFNERQITALKYVNDMGSIKNKDYRKLFSVSHKTAHIELADLVQQQELKPSGSGRSTCYIKSNNDDQQHESIPNEPLINTFFATKKQITAGMYADEFNIDLAEAINQLQQFVDQGLIDKTTIDNETFYIKANQLSFI
jgi:predicted HTH transcriptional regulator